MEKRVEERRSSLKHRETLEPTFSRSGAWAVILSPGEGQGVTVGGKNGERVW